MLAKLKIETSQTKFAYSQRTILDGREYQLSFHWNQRASAWYLSIADENGVAIASGIRLVVDWPVTRWLVAENAPAGVISVFDLTRSQIEATISDLGTRVAVLYTPAAEV